MESAIELLESASKACANNAPLHEAVGAHDQAELDRRLAKEYEDAARHLKAVAG